MTSEEIKWNNTRFSSKADNKLEIKKKGNSIGQETNCVCLFFLKASGGIMISFANKRKNSFQVPLELGGQLLTKTVLGTKPYIAQY